MLPLPVEEARQPVCPHQVRGKKSTAVQEKVNKRTREAISDSDFTFQRGERSRENREHQTAAEVSLSDESKLCRYSSLREDQQGGAGLGPEQVSARSTTSDTRSVFKNKSRHSFFPHYES